MARADVSSRASMRVPDIRKGDQVLVLSGQGSRQARHGRARHAQSAGLQEDRQQVRLELAQGQPAGRRRDRRSRASTSPSDTPSRAPSQGRTERQPRIQQGGILDVPQPILASKVMVICPHCGEPTRVKHGMAGDGRSVRLCTNCGETLVARGAEVSDETVDRRGAADGRQRPGRGRPDGARG